MSNVSLKQTPTSESIARLKAKSWWTNKHALLNEVLTKIVPNTHLVAHPSDTQELEACLKFAGNILPSKTRELKMTPMKVSRCHDNSLKLYMSGKVSQMRSGYALSGDGLWRHHSWCIDKEGRIVETTEPRLVYVSPNQNSSYVT